jgi:hypothetical protein
LQLQGGPDKEPIDALNHAATPTTVQVQQFTLPPGKHDYTVKAHSIALLRLEP